MEGEGIVEPPAKPTMTRRKAIPAIAGFTTGAVLWLKGHSPAQAQSLPLKEIDPKAPVNRVLSRLESFSRKKQIANTQEELKRLEKDVHGKSAMVMINDKDEFIQVNGNEQFRVLSCIKPALAVAVIKKMQENPALYQNKFGPWSVDWKMRLFEHLLHESSNDALLEMIGIITDQSNYDGNNISSRFDTLAPLVVSEINSIFGFTENGFSYSKVFFMASAQTLALTMRDIIDPNRLSFLNQNPPDSSDTFRDRLFHGMRDQPSETRFE